VQFWCFMVAAWIAYYIVWGSKKWICKILWRRWYRFW
jgi:hypothetical protein